ncbi:MAG: SseB family protein [Elusimicrobia bacterium]|nr:SseB family protein [Elusimicrobiota bacterium]
MEDFVPGNRLEELLKAAADGDGPSQGPFLRALLDEPLIAVGKVGSGSGLALELWGIGGGESVPVFTSRPRLDAALAQTGFKPADVLEVPGAKLLRMVPPEHPVFINPGSARGFRLTPAGCDTNP